MSWRWDERVEGEKDEGLVTTWRTFLSPQFEVFLPFAVGCARFQLLVMPSILLVVFFLQLAIHLVNTLGAQAINDLVCPPASAFIGPFHPTYTWLY